MGAMRTVPVFSSPHLDRLGDRLAADVAAGAIAGAALRVGGAGGALCPYGFYCS